MMLRHHRRVVAPAGPRSRGAGGRQEGETLLELMATVVLMGICIVALIGSLITAIGTAGKHRRITRVGNGAVNAAEVITAMDYIVCARATAGNGTVAGLDNDPNDSSYVYRLNQALPPNVEGMNYQIISVKRLRNTTSATAQWDTATSSCVTPDTGAQQITVRVTNTSGPGSIRRSITFVKRNEATDL